MIPIDRAAHWLTPKGAALRTQLLEHLARGGSTAAVVPDLDLRGLDLRSARLSGADLAGTQLAHARLDGADLSAARLAGASLHAVSALDVNLARTDLTGADLSIGNFARARLRGARLADARLDGAVFMAADLSGADLRGASLIACDWEDAWLIGTRTGRPPRRGSKAEWAAQSGYPTFAKATGHYLELLHRVPPKTYWILEASIEASPDAEAEVIALLREDNWRPTVVGAAALLAGAASPAAIAAAWAHLHRGSWAAPQLAGALLLVDPAFEPRARAELLTAMGSPPRWTATKTLASIVAAYRMLPGVKRDLLDAFEGLEREGRLDAEYALSLTTKWVSRAVETAPPHLQARWARAPLRAAQIL